MSVTLNWVGIAAINLALAVGFGAFGAHGLKAVASSEQLAWWHTGTLYWLIHALGLLGIGIMLRLGLAVQTSAWLLQVGMFIFAGTLFAMALGGPRWLGAITPVGGVMLIAGWLWLALQAFRYPLSFD